jgi:hypothetical protein
MKRPKRPERVAYLLAICFLTGYIVAACVPVIQRMLL